MSARCHSVSTNFSSDQRNALTGISRLRPFSLIKWQTPDSSCQSDVSLMSDVSDPGAVSCHQPGARHPVCHESSVSMSPSHHVICHLCDGVSDLLRVIRAHTTQLHQAVMSAVRTSCAVSHKFLSPECSVKCHQCHEDASFHDDDII